jgi:hypothetical protein
LKINFVKDKLLFCLMMVICLTGCGLKANPVPSSFAILPVQNEKKMAVTISENTIVLTWRFQDPKGDLRYMNIEKSRLGSAGNTCRDCPRTFERIGQLIVKDDKNEYRFTDSNVEKGSVYSYRLKICSEIGVCRESQVVEIEYK